MFLKIKKSFLKSSRPSLPLKKESFLPLRLSCKERLFSKTYPSFLTLKEGSTFLTKPLFPQGREDVAGYAIASARVLVSSAKPVP